MDILKEIKRVLAVERDALKDLEARIDKRAETAVEWIRDCRGRIVVTGMGKMGLIGRKIAATLTSTGTPALYLHPVEAFHGDLGVVGADDLLLAVSNSGETEEVNHLTAFLKRLRVRVIALTGNSNSTLAKQADLVLDISVREEADPLGVAPMSSTTAALAMGDALAAALIHLRGFTREQFAMFHPGGALGRRLLWRVSDLMHTGEAVPRVLETTPLKEAIVEMSKKRLGVVLVVDSEVKLAGIFTDGDLRRLLQRDSNPLDRTIGACMVRTPKVVQVDCLALEALNIMEEKNLSVMPVIDDRGYLQGVLHIHRLIEAKL
ncbi:MAG: KpsF/GutQ family sugar-phosphate isomerase [Myxococcales bacterium]|nr:MAG: KpsF/GutQ family sugar-phosphate isomerase [Myxococcales bacterium]